MRRVKHGWMAVTAALFLTGAASQAPAPSDWDRVSETALRRSSTHARHGRPPRPIAPPIDLPKRDFFMRTFIADLRYVPAYRASRLDPLLVLRGN